MKSGKLHGVGVDVFPAKVVNGRWMIDSPMIGNELVVFTPHIAGGTMESQIRCKKLWSDNVCRLLNGEKPLYIINDV